MEINVAQELSEQEMQRLLQLVRDAGCDSIVVNIAAVRLGPAGKGASSAASLTRRSQDRWNDELRAMVEARSDGKPIERSELIGFFVSKGLASTTANVYVSKAIAAGVIESAWPGPGYRVSGQQPEHGEVDDEQGQA